MNALVIAICLGFGALVAVFFLALLRGVSCPNCKAAYPPARVLIKGPGGKVSRYCDACAGEKIAQVLVEKMA